MRWCIETDSGQVIEVTNLLDERGDETKTLALAEAIVIRFNDGTYQSLAVAAPVYPVQ